MMVWLRFSASRGTLMGGNAIVRAAVEARQASHDGPVVRVAPVPVEFQKVGQHQPDIIQTVGAARMAGDLRALLRATVAGSWVLALLTLANFATAEAVANQIRFAAEGQDPNDVARYLDLGFPLAALVKLAEPAVEAVAPPAAVAEEAPQG